MNIERIRIYCLSFKGTTEEFPFDSETLVFKVKGKIFALISVEDPTSINLKCEPEYALELREHHPEEIFPGYHMNKKHWNTVSLIGSLSDKLIEKLITHSYQRVIAGLPKKVQQELT